MSLESTILRGDNYTVQQLATLSTATSIKEAISAIESGRHYFYTDTAKEIALSGLYSKLQILEAASAHRKVKYIGAITSTEQDIAVKLESLLATAVKANPSLNLTEVVGTLLAIVLKSEDYSLTHIKWPDLYKYLDTKLVEPE